LYQGTVSAVPYKATAIRALAVEFQEVVVHSVENCEADVAKQKLSQEAEWTTTIMLD
jgi:hypothetical protein